MMVETTPLRTHGSETQISEVQITASRPRSLLGNTVWNGLFAFWTTAVTFFFTPFLVARLGDAHYGLYALLMSIGGLLGIMNLGLGEASLRYVAYYYGRDDLEGINRVLRATLSVYVGTALLSAVVLILGAEWIVGWLAVPVDDLSLATSVLRLTGINFGLVLLGQGIGSVPQALQRFDISTRVQIAQSAVQVLGSVIVILAGFGLYGLFGWIVATSAVTLAVNIIVAKRLIPRIQLKPLPTKRGLREVLSYGIFSLITSGLGMVWGQADRILLGMLVSSSAVGYLSIPWNLTFRLLSSLIQVGNVLFAKFSTMQNAQDRQRLYLLATWTMLCGTVVVFVPITVLLPDFLRLWIGSEFAEKSSRVGQIIAASCIVRGAFIPYEALFRGIGKPQYLTRVVVLTSVTSLAVNLVLIPRYGLLGAGYAYCLTLIWDFAAVYFAWRHVLAIQAVKSLIQSIVVPILVGFGALGLGFILRSNLATVIGWQELGLVGMLLFLGGTLMVVTAELLLGGRSSHSYTLFHYLRSFVKKVA